MKNDPWYILEIAEANGSRWKYVVIGTYKTLSDAERAVNGLEPCPWRIIECKEVKELTPSEYIMNEIGKNAEKTDWHKSCLP